jgi:hypothetical protein
VLAKPVNRTLILLAAEGSGYVAVWSPHVEADLVAAGVAAGHTRFAALAST